MRKTRRISIELHECDPNELKYMDADERKKTYDENGKGTHVEYHSDAGTSETGGGEHRYEHKAGHISGEEAAKIVKKLINEDSTKKKVIFKSLIGIGKETA
jgi:hypothetical protein